MPYEETIEKDIKRAKEILQRGKPDVHEVFGPIGGTIIGVDIYPAYKILESLVQEIETNQFRAKLTKLPTKTIDAMPTPEELMPAIVELRDAALKAAHFDFAVILSHTHAWLYWLRENWKELNEATSG